MDIQSRQNPELGSQPLQKGLTIWHQPLLGQQLQLHWLQVLVLQLQLAQFGSGFRIWSCSQIPLSRVQPEQQLRQQPKFGLKVWQRSLTGRQRPLLRKDRQAQLTQMLFLVFRQYFLKELGSLGLVDVGTTIGLHMYSLAPQVQPVQQVKQQPLTVSQVLQLVSTCTQSPRLMLKQYLLAQTAQTEEFSSYFWQLGSICCIFTGLEEVVTCVTFCPLSKTQLPLLGMQPMQQVRQRFWVSEVLQSGLRGKHCSLARLQKNPEQQMEHLWLSALTGLLRLNCGFLVRQLESTIGYF